MTAADAGRAQSEQGPTKSCRPWNDNAPSPGRRTLIRRYPRLGGSRQRSHSAASRMAAFALPRCACRKLHLGARPASVPSGLRIRFSRPVGPPRVWPHTVRRRRSTRRGDTLREAQPLELRVPAESCCTQSGVLVQPQICYRRAAFLPGTSERGRITGTRLSVTVRWKSFCARISKVSGGPSSLRRTNRA